MKAALIRRILIEGRVDTKKYRYVLSDYTGQVIKRVPIDKVNSPDDWETVYYFSEEKD